MRERLYRVEAIVLKRSDHGEADRLLTLLTPDHGKMRAIAKGARKPSSRKSGHVELFTHCALMLAKGKTHDVVTQADTIDSFIELRDNLDRVGYAYYIAELVDRFSEEATENRALYDLLLHTLGWLGDESNRADLLARFFELRLLQYVGYQPQLFECTNCGKAVEPIENYFSAEVGGVLDPECAQAQRRVRDAQKITLNALKVLRYLQTRDWETVRGLRLTPDVMTEVEVLLQRYIVYHLERSLKSVDFLRELRRNEG
jgi:DNA repair protein RecO (recombination protein O)